MSVSLDELTKIRKEADCLYSQSDVEQALERMAKTIESEVKENNPLILCVMNGALVTTAGLINRFDFPLQQDYIHATRYRGNTTGGAIHWLAEPRISVEGRVVLIVDDILDEGNTLVELVSYCQSNGASKVMSAVLVEKVRQRDKDIKADFVGLQVPDRYVFGYGMDYKEYWRNAPGIFAVKGS